MVHIDVAQHTFIRGIMIGRRYIALTVWHAAEIASRKGQTSIFCPYKTMFLYAQKQKFVRTLFGICTDEFLAFLQRVVNFF